MTVEAFGPVAYEIKRSQLVEIGRNVPVELVVIPTEYMDGDYLAELERGYSPDWVSMITRLSQDSHRNAMIFDITARILEGDPNAKVLMLNARVEECKNWAARFEQIGHPCGLLIGGAENKDRLEDSIRGMAFGKLRIGVGTTVADEGLDIPPLTHVVLTCPGHSHPKRMVQQVGRAARVYPGKEKATCIYFWDREMFPNPFLPDGPEFRRTTESESEERNEEFLKKLARNLEAKLIMKGD